jgi:hypothetical protein
MEWYQVRQGVITGERKAIIDHRAHVIALGNVKYSTWHKLRCVVSAGDLEQALTRHREQIGAGRDALEGLVR